MKIIFLFRSSNALFDLVWQPDGSVCFRANNGKYVATKRSGHLYANSDTVEESCKYFFYLINRLVVCSGEWMDIRSYYLLFHVSFIIFVVFFFKIC